MLFRSKTGLGAEALAGQQKLGAAQETARKETLGQVERLANLDAIAKKELFDNELQFRKDAANNTFFTERQLADYKRQAATSDEQMRSWANTAQNYHKRNIASLEAVYNKLTEITKNDFMVGEQRLDQAARKEIIALQKDTERRIRDAKNRAAKAVAGWQLGGAVLGGVGGAFLGGPAGAMAGAQAGSALGGTIGAQQAGQEEI